MLDLYHGQIQKDDVILCNTGNPLITEASDLFRGTSNQKTSGPYASFRFELRHDRFERVARLTRGKGVGEKRGCKKQFSSTLRERARETESMEPRDSIFRGS